MLLRLTAHCSLLTAYCSLNPHRQGEAVVLRGVVGQEPQEVDGAPVLGGENFPVEGGGASKSDVVGDQQPADF